MPRIVFIEHDGTSRIVDAQDGQTLMQAAVGNRVRGILAECGGGRVCGTCHCHVDEAWLGAAGTASEDELLLLGFSEHHRPNSRLSCQIRVTGAMDGMVVRVPPSQP